MNLITSNRVKDFMTHIILAQTRVVPEMCATV